MTLEDTLIRSLHDHLDPVVPPPVDLAAVRRSGERRRAVAAAAGLVTALALAVGGTALITMPGADDRVVRPTELPAMDFGEGTRAFYSYEDGRLHLGGESFAVGMATSMDTQASATPRGVVWLDEQQRLLLLREDGSVEVMADGPDDPRTIYTTVKFEADGSRVAWLTRGADGADFNVYSFDDREHWRLEVPCEGDACADLAVAGLDHGRGLVRRLDADQTLVVDLETRDGWATIDGFRAADVRNRVVLGDGTLPDGETAALGAGWRFVQAEGPESLLTFDGAHELYWSDVLRATDGGRPLRLDVNARGTQFVNLDSDGSVMVAVMSGRDITWFDCLTTDGSCEQFARTSSRSGDPTFLGNDM